MPRKFARSVSYAVNGIKLGMLERNMKIHLMAAVLVTILGFFFQVSRIEWAILLVCVGCVISMELCNTAFEEICDVIAPIHNEAYQRMGKPKDVGAGAVLVSSLMALIVGSLIFIPHIISFFTAG